MRSVGYETERDKANEKRIASLLRSRGNTVNHLRQFYPCDFLITQPDGYRYIAEYKRRSHNFGTFPTIWMPAQKIAQCFGISNALRVPFHLIVEFDDGIYENTCPISDLPDYGGREDRDTYEPMCAYLTNQFRRMDL